MLQSIFQWLTQAIAGGLDLIVNAFIDCLNLELSAYLTAFPLLADVYDIMKYIGLGMTLLVGTIGLFNFVMMKSVEAKYIERPEQILLRTAVAAGLINYGGYILSYIVGLAKLSFDLFYNLDASKTGELSSILSADALGQAVGALTIAGSITDLTLVTVELVLVGLIAYNLLKLTLEVAERYMMVGVLVFTSPLAYCTLASGSTLPIFKRWCSMFFSSCLMMSMSVLFLRLITNGLFAVEPGGSYFIQLLLVLAMCKIAQRVDNYLNQLGLTTAITGGDLLSDLGGAVMAARTGSAMLGRAFNGKGSRNTVLGGNNGGSAGVNTPVPQMRAGGLGAAVVNGIRQSRSSFINGASVSDSARAGAKVVGDTMKRTAIGGAVSGGIEAHRNGASVATGAVKGAMTGTAAGAAQMLAPGTMNERRTANAVNEAHRIAENETAAAASAAASAGSAHLAVPQEIRDRIAMGGKPFTDYEAAQNYASYGVAEEGKSALSPSGIKNMDAYRSDAVRELKAGNTEFAEDYAGYCGSRDGHFAEGSPEYMSAETFNSKWGTTISGKASAMAFNDVTGDGFGTELCDNARAAGLTMQTAANGEHYVHGGEQQIGAFLANEYGREAPIPVSLGKTDEDYRNMAIHGLAAEPPAGMDASAYRADMDTMDKTDFMRKYSPEISSRAADYKASDASTVSDARNGYYSTVSNTAAQASPNAILHSFFDNSGELRGDDRLGNAMLERGFGSIAAQKAEGSSFSNIRAYDRPAGYTESGEALAGGRVIEATYIRRGTGSSERVRIYDEVAYSSMSDERRAGLYSYIASDGRQLYTNINYAGEARGSAPVASAADRRVMPQSGKKTGSNNKSRPIAPIMPNSKRR